MPSHWHSSRINCASLISFDCALVFSASSADTAAPAISFWPSHHRAVDVAGSARSVLTTTPIAVGRSSLAVLRSQIIRFRHGTVLNAGSHGYQLQLGGIPDAQRRTVYFLLTELRVGCHVAAFWLGAAAITLIFSFFGFLASRLPFCWPFAMSIPLRFEDNEN